MPHYPQFFLANTDYSIRNYLRYIEANGQDLIENDVKTYIQWYRTDLNWKKAQKNISLGQIQDLERALDELTHLADRDLKATIMNTNNPETPTIVNKYINKNSINAPGNTISFLQSSQLFKSPPPPPPQQQQQQQEVEEEEEEERQAEPSLLTPVPSSPQPELDDYHIHSHTDTNSRFRSLTPQSIHQFKESYAKMVDSMKWKLGHSGKFVEDIMYEYGLKSKKESVVHSFILAIDDDGVRELFDDDDWEEVLSKCSKKDPELPDNVEKILHDLDQTDATAIFDVLKDPTKRYQDYNTRTICYAVESILYLLEADPNPLQSRQLEQWYQANVWTPVIDKILGDIPGVICILGESTSHASKERKRQETGRVVARIGTRSDMIIRKVSNGVPLEYGVGEDGALYEGHSGRKKMHEAELKLPKTMKDMMSILCNECDWNKMIMKDIEVVGYCHSGTVSEFLVMDNPDGYVCRVTRSDCFELPTDIDGFNKLLILLAISLRLKLRISRSIDAMKRKPLNLASATMTSRKRKTPQSLADTLTTPTRTPNASSKKRNPYTYYH